MKIMLASTCENVGSVYKNFLLGYEEVESVTVVHIIEDCIEVLAAEDIDLAVVSVDVLKRMTASGHALRAVNIEQPKKVLMVDQVSGRVVMDAIGHGFNDVVGLGLPGEEIMARLRMVITGETDISARSYVRGILDLVGVDNKARFANDEIDLRILLQLAHGCSNKEIAQAVSLSLQTVRNRISRLMHATGAQNRTQLALMFLQE